MMKIIAKLQEENERPFLKYFGCCTCTHKWYTAALIDTLVSMSAGRGGGQSSSLRSVDGPLHLLSHSHPVTSHSLHLMHFCIHQIKNRLQSCTEVTGKALQPSCCPERHVRKPEIEPPVGFLRPLQIPPEPQRSHSTDR